MGLGRLGGRNSRLCATPQGHSGTGAHTWLGELAGLCIVGLQHGKLLQGQGRRGCSFWTSLLTLKGREFITAKGGWERRQR